MVGLVKQAMSVRIMALVGHMQNDSQLPTAPFGLLGQLKYRTSKNSA